MHANIMFLIVIALLGERILQNEKFYPGLYPDFFLYLGTQLFPFFLFQWSISFIGIYTVFIIARVSARVYLNKRFRGISEFISVLLIFLLFPIFETLGLSVNRLVTVILGLFQSHSVLGTAKRNANNIYTALLGVLLVGFELNNVVRYVIKRYHFFSEDSADTINSSTSVNNTTNTQKDSKESLIGKDELNRGYAIGVIERSIIFLLVWMGKPEAVSLVLAAKGVYRYRSLEEKNFAEYVLLGTLLSMFISIVSSYMLLEFVG